jgi:signal transduction histidine kinase
LGAIPADRFSLSLHGMDRWFYLEDGVFSTGEGRGLRFLQRQESFSATRWVVKHQSALLRYDIRGEERFEYDQVLISEGMRSDLIVPLFVHDRVVGTLNLTCRTPDQLTNEHLSFVQAAAGPLASAVQQFEMRERAEAISSISKAIQTSLDIDEILQMVVDHIQAQGYDRVRLFRLDEAAGEMVGRAEAGLGIGSAFRQVRLSVKDDVFTQQTLSTDAPLIYRTDSEAFKALNDTRRQLGNEMSRRLFKDRAEEWGEIPLRTVEGGKEVSIGKIAVDNALSGRSLDPVHLGQLMDYASHAAVAIRHAELFERVSAQSSRFQLEVASRTQALEEQNAISLAYIRISESVLSMSCASDIETVISTCMQELKLIGMSRVTTMAVHRVIDSEVGTFETYRIGPGGIIGPPDRLDRNAPIFRKWRQRQAQRVGDLDAPELRQTGLIVEEVRAKFSGLHLKSLIDIPFSHGILSAHSLETNAFSEGDEVILVEVGKLIATGLQRVRDLDDIANKNAELSHRSKRQHAFLTISRAVQRLKGSDEIGALLQVCRAELCRLSIPVDAIMLRWLLPGPGHVLESVRVGPQGLHRIDRKEISDQSYSEEWERRCQRVIDDRNDDQDTTTRELFRANYDGLPIRSTIALPFDQGMFFAHSLEPRVFSSEVQKVIESILDILSIGIARMRDIEALEDHAHKLQGEVSERRRAELRNEELIVELEAKNEELGRFVYAVSHDLKSPLVTIEGFLGHLKKDTKAGNESRMSEDIGHIVSATDRMNDLLDDLLSLSRIGRLDNDPEQIVFHALVEDALALVQGRLDAAEATVQVASSFPGVVGDRTRLLNLMQNLIDNAAKFGCVSEDLRIEIGCRQGDRSVFYVADNGPGIPERFHEKVFGLFERLDSTVPGTGLGLSLARRIVEHHGGSIWVESEGDGQGATFCFTLEDIT